MADEANTANPVALELLERNRDQYAGDPEESITALMERLGGREVVEQALNALTMADITLYPSTVMVRTPQSIRQAIMSGFTLGVAACDRVREIETQMRDMGME